MLIGSRVLRDAPKRIRERRYMRRIRKRKAARLIIFGDKERSVHRRTGGNQSYTLQVAKYGFRAKICDKIITSALYSTTR